MIIQNNLLIRNYHIVKECISCSIKRENSCCNVVDQPVNSMKQIFTCDGATPYNGPVMGLYTVEIQYLTKRTL